MRNTVIALALGLLFLAGLFALPRFFAHKLPQTAPAQTAAQIEPGFAGVRRIGPWILACTPARKKPVPLPFSFGPAKPAAQTGQSIGRCRTFIAFRRKADPQQVILLLNFRLLGRAQRLVMLIRVPPGAKKGDIFTIRLGEKMLKLPVSSCEAGSCLAAGSLTPREEALFYESGAAQLALPPGKNGKRLAVRVPLQGLRAAVSAMRRAQIGD